MTKQLDLLLINAPSRIGVYGPLSEFAAIEPPVWALFITRYCLNRGYSVEILDAEAEGLTTSQTAALINEINPKLAVFCIYGQQPSASTQCLPAARETAMMVDGRVPTLALGTHPSALPERTLREGPWTYVCQGEGPYQTNSILGGLKHYSNDDHPILSPGVWTKTPDNKIYFTHAEELIQQLDDQLPNQAWELLDMKKYRPHHWHLWTGDPNGGYASVQTSLGCPWKCQFCCINIPFGGNGYRMWSPANVAAQIANLVNAFGITNIKIPDEMFVLNRQHVWQICNHLIDMKLGDQLNIWAYARIDTVKDTQLLDKMRRAGFKWLGIGIESASKHVRDGVEKGRFGNEQITQAVGRVKAAGIRVGANYIFGLPDDTLGSMRKTFDLACEINSSYSNFYTAMAYPGAPLHKTAQEKGWLLPEDTDSGWAGYSQHNYYTLPLPTETLTAAEVLAFRDNAFMNYHLRPEYLNTLRTTFGDQAVEDMKNILALGKPKRKLLGD